MRDPMQTILLVEDDRMVSDLLCSILKRQGYRVLRASSGAETIQVGALHPDQIDLLVSDVMLEQETVGTALTHLLELYPHLRVLLLSGFPMQSLSEQGLLEPSLLEKNNVFFLQKPFPLGEFVHAIQRALSPQALHAQLS